jgi:hypothetical protein
MAARARGSARGAAAGCGGGGDLLLRLNGPPQPVREVAAREVHEHEARDQEPRPAQQERRVIVDRPRVVERQPAVHQQPALLHPAEAGGIEIEQDVRKPLADLRRIGPPEPVVVEQEGHHREQEDQDRLPRPAPDGERHSRREHRGRQQKDQERHHIGPQHEGAIPLGQAGVRREVAEEARTHRQHQHGQETGRQGSQELAPDVLGGPQRGGVQQVHHLGLGVADQRHARGHRHEEGDQVEGDQRVDVRGLVLGIHPGLGGPQRGVDRAEDPVPARLPVAVDQHHQREDDEQRPAQVFLEIEAGDQPQPAQAEPLRGRAGPGLLKRG